MTKEGLEKLKETVAYFGHWYDVIGEERVSILEKSIEYITDLEKENAELKARLNAINLLTPELEKLSKAKTQQLTKAKEHIKTLLDCLKQDTNDPQTNYYVCQYMDKAKQFIKEIEECLD